jgi:GNAT superfamily N-acetyltransferase
MNHFQLINDYKDIPEYRLSFNQLAGETFGIDFEKWYQNGFWDDRYLGYAYIDGNQVIANVSVSKMDLLINGQPQKALQIGTVMTRPAYRNKGLARDLMNIVLAEYARDYDFIYLFANQNVLDFYPRFGFQPVRETLFSSKVNTGNPGRGRIRKLDVSNPGDLHLIYRMVSRRIPVSRTLGAVNNQSIFMWYCFNVFGDALYYWEAEESIIIFAQQANILHVYDYISPKPTLFQPVLDQVATRETEQVIFYFTPEFEDIEVTPSIFESDDVMFVKTTAVCLPWRFKYPKTAQA